MDKDILNYVTLSILILLLLCALFLIYKVVSLSKKIGNLQPFTSNRDDVKESNEYKNLLNGNDGCDIPEIKCVKDTKLSEETYLEISQQPSSNSTKIVELGNQQNDQTKHIQPYAIVKCPNTPETKLSEKIYIEVSQQPSTSNMKIVEFENLKDGQPYFINLNEAVIYQANHNHINSGESNEYDIPESYSMFNSTKISEEMYDQKSQRPASTNFRVVELENLIDGQIYFVNPYETVIYQETNRQINPNKYQNLRKSLEVKLLSLSKNTFGQNKPSKTKELPVYARVYGNVNRTAKKV